MECSLAQVGANTAWTIIIATIVIGVGAAVLVLSRRKAPALAMMILAVGVVGAGAGAGTATAGSSACEPVCFDVGARGDEEVPDYDLLLTSDDGVYFEGAVYQSSDGTCSGSPSLAGVGVIADTQEEAEALCEGDVTNLQATAPAGTTPLPAANLWGCSPV